MTRYHQLNSIHNCQRKRLAPKFGNFSLKNINLHFSHFYQKKHFLKIVLDTKKIVNPSIKVSDALLLKEIQQCMEKFLRVYFNMYIDCVASLKSFFCIIMGL